MKILLPSVIILAIEYYLFLYVFTMEFDDGACFKFYYICRDIFYIYKK